MKKWSLAQSGLDDPIGFDREKLCLLSLIQSFPDDPNLHYYMLYFILIKTQKKNTLIIYMHLEKNNILKIIFIITVITIIINNFIVTVITIIIDNFIINNFIINCFII